MAFFYWCTMKGFPGFLVEVVTQDSLRLHGFYQRPVEPSGELWVLVHGVASNFYAASLLNHLADSILHSGRSVLRINTRGHDPMSFQSGGLVAHRGGAAFEIVSDSIHDLRAWVRFGEKLGYRSIGVLGHSLGAIKSLYYAIHSDSENIDRVIAISPPRLNYEAFDRESGVGFHESIEQAKHWIDQGKSEHVMHVRYPFPMLISAKTFFDKYGTSNTYDYMPWVRKISVPSLWVFGGVEVGETKASFLGADQRVAEQIGEMSTIDLRTIPDGDHNYTRARTALAKTVVDWMGGSLD